MNIEQAQIGILGGGQLGKMLNYTANQWNLSLSILDKDPSYPSGINAWQFVQGDFQDYDDVMRFGAGLDVLGVEIEHVNIQALYDLEKQGTRIHPHPRALEIIKDKYEQNQFYLAHNLPTIGFEKHESRDQILEAVRKGQIRIPFVQKTRGEGYDGRGVHMVDAEEGLSRLLDGPSITEDTVAIRKELAVVAARNERGEIKCFDPVEMVFNEQNMLAYLYAPADIPPEVADQLDSISRRTIEAFGICGLLAIEYFLTETGELLINEVAPRPHNSGHHTLENAVTSQFEQHLRGLLNLPLGSTRLVRPAAMLNLLGEPGYQGPPSFQGMDEILSLEDVHIHIYGKPETRPFRKMGHVTVLGTDRESIEEKINRIQSTLKVISI